MALGVREGGEEGGEEGGGKRRRKGTLTIAREPWEDVCVELLVTCSYSVLDAPPAIPAVAMAAMRINLNRNNQVLHAGGECLTDNICLMTHMMIC